MKCNHYYTGLIDGDDRPTRHRYRGKAWSIQLVAPNPDYAKDVRGREIRIDARSATIAQRALDQVWAIHSVMAGAVDLPEAPVIRPPKAAPPSDDNPFPPYSFHYLCTYEFRDACKLAARASHRRDLVYAIALLHQSQKLHVNHPIDLEPRMFPYEQRSPLPRDHVRFAYATVMAYAAIEQLGLQIRASVKNPSMINGQWNPAVRDELIERLRKAGIDSNETMLWLMRGARTRIEASRPPRPQAIAPWSGGAIRDCKVTLIDAIADVSWLRSCIASHRMGSLVGLLSVHDVANAQGLAVRLIFERLGYWKAIRRRRPKRRL